jgi:endonuclease/exonuclease/phosphatase family metal-dependent hydrolase
MKKISILVLFLSGILNLCFSQQDAPSAKNSCTIAFWNVDKLYDLNNDPAVNDEDFLPSSPKQWNKEKYEKKISDLAKILSSINEKELPVLIGLAEVENQKVLEDLAASQKLRRGKYGIIHYDIKDPDGLEVALLYKKDEIEIIDSKSIPIVFGFDIKDVTSDILYVKCKIKDDNTFHLFINHWPSRLPNEQESEILRISAAITLRKEVDNILNLENKARIIIMGDFNDEPTNKSIMQMLNATDKRKNLYYRDLYNMTYDAHNLHDEGSVYLNDTWLMFDQIIVSPELFTRNAGYNLSFGEGKVYRGEEPQKPDTQAKILLPEPTYSGDKYIGGPGSHFPVFIILQKEDK